MKAVAFPGAKRAVRRAIKRRGRRRHTLVTLKIGAWSATFRIAGIGIVHVPTLACEKARNQ